MKEVTNSSNCHTTGAKQQTSKNVQGTNTSSDQDSSRSKNVEKTDRRKRQDGPGGN